MCLSVCFSVKIHLRRATVCLPAFSLSLTLTLSVYTTHCYRRTPTALLASHRPTRGARRRRAAAAAATAKATTKYTTTTIVNRSSNSLCKVNRVAVVSLLLVVVVFKRVVAVVVVLKRMLGLELCVVCVCVCVIFGIFGHYLISVN